MVKWYFRNWAEGAESVIAFTDEEDRDSPYNIAIIERARKFMRRLHRAHPALLEAPVWGD